MLEILVLVLYHTAVSEIPAHAARMVALLQYLMVELCYDLAMTKAI
jgi:hypothetical protein